MAKLHEASCSPVTTRSLVTFGTSSMRCAVGPAISKKRTVRRSPSAAYCALPISLPSTTSASSSATRTPSSVICVNFADTSETGVAEAACTSSPVRDRICEPWM